MSKYEYSYKYLPLKVEPCDRKPRSLKCQIKRTLNPKERVITHWGMILCELHIGKSKLLNSGALKWGHLKKTQRPSYSYNLCTFKLSIISSVPIGCTVATKVVVWQESSSPQMKYFWRTQHMTTFTQARVTTTMDLVKSGALIWGHLNNQDSFSYTLNSNCLLSPRSSPLGVQWKCVTGI